ncbi:HAD hydrolase family protein [Kineothrix sedimenti]|uniref:HAD hydrolase family protein n=1 Tax=Kineothrix sedimenti TaxID=3123317 RepID=A0ABZ3EUF6_9FIRM
MENIKIVFFDIDGTLIDINKKIMTKRIEETLIGLKQNKIIICIATGRPLKSVPHFPNVEFDAFLTFNASYCCTKNEIIYKNPIRSSDVQTIIENAKRIQRPVSIASEARIGANGKDQDLIDYFAISDQSVEIVEDFDDLTKEDIYQIMIGCYKEEYYHLKKEEALAFGDGTNDIEMLQAVGTGVAMGNATNDVKDIADDICGSVAEDGIYFYCKKYHLI